MEKYTLNESIAHIEEIADTLVLFLGNLLEITNTDKVQLVGIGNSISAGWTAVDNNVQPWIKKLSPFIEDKCKKAGVDVEFSSYAIAGDNSNEKIYSFLASNPTLDEVRAHFIRVFDLWKTEFNGTAFENSVDKDEALKFYSQGEKRFFDCYDDSYFTITSFNGCTGELLEVIMEDISILFQKNGLDNVFQKELSYLQQIIDLVLRLSANSYVTVGNFPRISRKYLILLNAIIDRINKKIKAVLSKKEGELYFDKITLDLIVKTNVKIKLDNNTNF
ncbi:MAG: hypothetical protein K2J20_01900 [Bacilli bacterium]|nr:hypothetical protein [Bacilli bacterium]